MQTHPAPKKKILIIEDDNDLRRFLKIDLEVFFTVADSPNWLDARKRLQEERYDLILLDMILPDVSDPLEPLHCIRKQSQDFPVVLTSANPSLAMDLLDRLMRLGINSILAKPYTRDELLHAIRKHLPFF